MLCQSCHVHVRRDFPYCLHCGTLRKHAHVTDFGAPQLISVDDPQCVVDLAAPRVTIGRDDANDVTVADPSVSRHHAVIVRSPTGFTVEDLNTLNGTAVGEQEVEGKALPLKDGDVLHVGDVDFRFEQPRSIAIGSKTLFVGTEQTMLAVASGHEAATATEPLSGCPHRRSGWALKRVPDAKGLKRWVLRNTRSGQYLEIDERTRFIWEQIDGEATVRDILFEYAQCYGELALPRIELALKAFEGIGLVRGLSSDQPAPDSGLLVRAGRRVLSGLLRLEISVKGIDRVIGRLYRAGAWRFFTRTGVFLLWALTVAGLAGFVVARKHQHLFVIGGAGLWGALIVAGGYLVALMIHEMAHALAVKSYGRRVTRGGFMMMMGMPFAFVDTSDMWFGSRWSRVVVTMSGPLATAGMAGGFGLVAAEVTNPIIAGMAFQLSFGLYLNTLYNCNPLMPLDGYQALADSLQVPRLREEAMAYASRGVWRDVRARQRPSIRQYGLLFYGVAAVACSYLFLLLGIRTWNTRVGALVDRNVKPPFNTLLVVAVIGLVMFPVWYRYGRKLYGLVQRRMPRLSAEPDAVAGDNAVPA